MKYNSSRLVLDFYDGAIFKYCNGSEIYSENNANLKLCLLTLEVVIKKICILLHFTFLIEF